MSVTELNAFWLIAGMAAVRLEPHTLTTRVRPEEIRRARLRVRVSHDVTGIDQDDRREPDVTRVYARKRELGHRDSREDAREQSRGRAPGQGTGRRRQRHRAIASRQGSALAPGSLAQATAGQVCQSLNLKFFQKPVNAGR